MNKRLLAFGILTLLLASISVSGVAAQETGFSKILSNHLDWIKPLITGNAVLDDSLSTRTVLTPALVVKLVDAPEVEKTNYWETLDQVKIIASSLNYIALALISVLTLALIIRAIVKSRQPGHIYHHTKHFKQTHHYK